MLLLPPPPPLLLLLLLSPLPPPSNQAVQETTKMNYLQNRLHENVNSSSTRDKLITLGRTSPAAGNPESNEPAALAAA
jgi:hypothetical protein